MVKTLKRQMRVVARSEFVRGLSTLLEISPPTARRSPSRTVMSSLRGDMEKIGADFHRVIDRERSNEKAPQPEYPRRLAKGGGNHTHISVQSHKWEAPLPPPAVLDEFNRVVPNGAERIVRAWEQESEHRRAIEKTDQQAFYSDRRMGKTFALVFVLAALGVAAFCAYVGAEWLGAVIGGSTIASVVWAFIHQRRPPK